MATNGLFSHLIETDPLNGGRCAREVRLDELRRQTYGVENLCTAIGLIGRDAHLGHHLQHALADGLDIVLANLIGRLREAIGYAQVFQSFERQIGVHRLRAITRQHTEMVHFARFCGLYDQPRLHPQTLTDQVMVYGGRSQSRRNRNPLQRRPAIRQDQNVHVGQNGVCRLMTELLKGGL